MINEERLPHVIFRVADNLYAIDSSVTIALTEFPDNITPIQKSEKFELGVMQLRNQIVPVMSMRSLFGCKSSEEEYEYFKSVIDIRKNDHIKWVNELKNSVNENREFTLTTDPHQCAFGKWYDNFSTDIQSINFHMKR
ncbi:chemotaxis protein CheW [Paraclostridium sp. AKS81]|uniref:chemotaxis protein CheW n=1 Tax=Paraclostridium sp. AKS81 TaxID=2876117 RepID=UPI0021E0894C|nr:chemotaxis protein CheW [Paraclostridium sp. AKS81]MCU9810356.1 chemotaxis protein CheW [Paraclostridium sp. AKS81]